MNTRPVHLLDRPALSDLLRSIPQFNAEEYEVALNLVDSCISSKAVSGYHVLVADDNADICGYICFGNTPLTRTTWDIYWEAVTPEKQGHGVGTALILAADAFIRNAGGTLILIETSSRPDYEYTRNFYQKNGYSIAGIINDFYAPGDDKIIYAKYLNFR